MPIIAYDLKLKRPGCVLLQTVYGGTVSNFNKRFKVEDWLVFPTPDLKVYEITDEQLEQFTELHSRGKVINEDRD